MRRWQRSQLFDAPGGRRRRVVLASRPTMHRDHQALFVHDPEDPSVGQRKLCFAAHSHSAGAFSRGRFLTSMELGHRLELQPEQPYLVNVGSVGWPIDGDPRAGYVVTDGRSVEWRRVRYPVERTVLRLCRLPYDQRIRRLHTRGLRRGSCLA